jgi:hypothetical protein
VLALLSTVQSLPDDAERAALERALLPLARDAALGALSPGLAHDAGNALFGLVGLLGLLEADTPISRERIELLQHSADDLDAVLRPALEFLRATRDDQPTADLAAAARLAVSLYAHGDHPPVDTRIAAGEVLVACPIALAQQAAIHLLLAAAPGTRITLELADGALSVSPADAETLDELVARRIAVDHGGRLERDGATLRLHLPPA